MHARAEAIWDFELRNADGSQAGSWSVSNFLTDVGRAHIAARLALSPPSAMTHMAIGTGSGQTQASTTLATEVARVALTSGDPLLSGTEVRYQATFGSGTPATDVTVTEAAIFSASSAGNMMNYASGFSKPKASTQTLTVTCRVRILG